MIRLEEVTWRMRVRVDKGRPTYLPAFLAYGVEEIKVVNSLPTILNHIKDEYIRNKGRIALSFTRNDEEFYTLSTSWCESAETFIEKCQERITWFCARHEIPLKEKDYRITP